MDRVFEDGELLGSADEGRARVDSQAFGVFHVAQGVASYNAGVHGSTHNYDGRRFRRADPEPRRVTRRDRAWNAERIPTRAGFWGKLPRVSTGTKPQVLLPAYDAQDLRRRIPVCFTIGELYTFATKLQVPQTPAWSNNPQEAARDIVRHFERSGALAFLVEALRETKPLVEWPEPLPLPVPPAPAPAPAAAAPVAPTIIGLAEPSPAASAAPATPARGVAASGAGGGATILGVPAPQALEFADTALEAPGDRPTPITDVPEAVLHAATHRSSPPAAHPAPAPAPAPAAPAGFAPSMMRRPGDAPDAPAPAASAPAQASETMPASLRVSPAEASPPRPAPARPAASAWPATHRSSADAPPSRGPDPRVLMGVGAGILLALIGVAFLAGRASSASVVSGSGSGTTSGAPAPPSDHVVMSQNVVDALGTSLLRVAKACQIDPGSLRGRSLFEVAYRRCGPLPAPAAQPRTGGYDPDPPADPGQPGDADPPAPTGKKGARTTGANKPPQRPDPSPGQPNTSGSGCLSGCSRSHGACTAKCGAEPQQGSQYDAYQSCLGGCLKALSQCKMGCQ